MKSLGFFTLSFLLAASAQAFTLVGTNPDLKGWEDVEVKLDVNTSNCPASVDVVGLIAEAASVWNNVPTSRIKVSYGTSTTSTTFSNPTTVYCETNFQTVTGAHPDYVPAAASPWAPAGTITSGLLYLNASSGQANIANFDRTKLVIIVAHEIGHILGLGHSQVTNSLMYYDATYKATLNLSQDDMDGMSYLYPRNELSGDKMMGCGLVASAAKLPPPSGPNAGLLATICLLPFLAWFGLRGRREQEEFSS